MDYIPDLETLSLWLIQYGSIALFILLALGIIALPVPEETLMVIAGTLMGNGHLLISPTIFAAFAGSVTGITISYLIGRTLGIFFIHKYGCWVGIREHHVQKVHVWFERFGKWALFVGYFIPGVRHFTGFTAGTSELSFRQFAIYAYTGALFWVSTFLSLGYFFGHYCVDHCQNMEIGTDKIIIATAVVMGGALGLWWYRRKKIKRKYPEN